MADLSGVVQSIVMIANLILTGHSNWNKASVEYKEFPGKVSGLEKIHREWKELIEKYSLPPGDSLVAAVIEAEQLLKNEQVELSKRASIKLGGVKRFSSLTHKTVFPSSLGQSIDKATKAFTDIVENQKKEEEREAAVLKQARKQSMPLSFRQDSRYIPLERTENAVKSALELETPPPNPDNPVVVLLHGGSGKGKSSLARNVALHYHSILTKKELPVFERVVHLECGPAVNLSAKLSELRSRLGWDAAAMKGTGEGGEEQGSANAGEMVCKDVMSLLKIANVLIVLDDVGRQDRDFLKGMYDVCGKNVKLLITSQHEDLCLPFTFNRNCTRIAIEKPTQEDAQRLLAAHAGFPLGVPIPDEVKVLMNDIIEKTEAHPHAMASVATAIHRERPGSVGEWERAVDTYSELLSSEDTVFIHDKPYPHSFWQATKIKFDGLGPQAKHLMALLSMCKGPSVPEAVVELLYNRIKEQPSLTSDPPRPFSLLKSGLESRQFYNVTYTESQVAFTEQQLSWSLHSLDRLYIDETSDNEKKALFEIIAGAQSPLEIFVGAQPIDIVKVVAALYFVDEFARKIVSDLSFPRELRGELPFRLGPGGHLDLRKAAIEPLTQLLVKKVNNRWPRILHSSARQVFLNYICYGELYKEGVSILLKSPISGRAMLSALHQIDEVDPFWGLNGVHIAVGQEIIDAVLDLLGDKVKRSCAGYGSVPEGASSRIIQLNVAQCDALTTLARLGSSAKNEILSFPGIVQSLAYAFGTSSDRNLQTRAARTLNILTSSKGWWEGPSEHADAVLQSFFPTVVKELVHTLRKTNSPDLQDASALVLWNLATIPQTREKLVNFPKILEGIVTALVQDSNPGLRGRIAQLLSELAAGGFDTRKKILAVPGVFQSFIGALDKANAVASWLKTLKAVDRLTETRHLVDAISDIIECIFLFGTLELQLEVKRLEGLFEGILEAVMLSPATMEIGVGALMLLDSGRGRELDLAMCSGKAYKRRGRAELILGLDDDAARDLDEACRRNPDDVEALSYLVFLRAKRDDIPGALALLERCLEIQPSDPVCLQERGILKRLMGDLEGALMDLDASLNLEPGDYEMLKHRGLVKFLFKDEEGARADAEMALTGKPQHVDAPAYEKGLLLGARSVEYLNYHLK